MFKSCSLVLTGVEGEDTDPEDGEYMEDEARDERSDEGRDMEQGELGCEMNLPWPPPRPMLTGEKEGFIYFMKLKVDLGISYKTVVQECSLCCLTL